MLEKESSELKFFLSHFPCKVNSIGQNVYRFTGFILATFDTDIQVPDGKCIVLSYEKIAHKNAINLHLVPPKILTSIIKFSGFYESIKIVTWENKSLSGHYSSKILYGFESNTDQKVTNIIIKFPTYSILIFAPTDPQLESIYISLQRLLHKYNRIAKEKIILNANIEQVLSETLTDTYFKRIFSHLFRDSASISVFSNKKYIIEKSLEIFARILK